MNSAMKITFEVKQFHKPTFTSYTESQEIIKKLFQPPKDWNLELPFNVSFVFGDGTELMSKEVIDRVIDNRFTMIFTNPTVPEDYKKIQLKDVMDIEPNAFINLLR